MKVKEEEFCSPNQDGTVRKTSAECKDFILRQTFQRRRKKLQKVCQKYANILRGENGGLGQRQEVDEPRFFATIEPSFAVCMIPKVASTSLSNFLITSHSKLGRAGEFKLKFNTILISLLAQQRISMLSN